MRRYKIIHNLDNTPYAYSVRHTKNWFYHIFDTYLFPDEYYGNFVGLYKTKEEAVDGLIKDVENKKQEPYYRVILETNEKDILKIQDILKIRKR